MNVVLAGFMGSGKTTVGKLLAKKIGWEFFDTDQAIEKQIGKSIPDIFLTDGEEKFRIIERTVIQSVTKADQPNYVISLGGGALLNPDNVADLKKNGVLIWLKVNPNTVLQRIPNSSSRPLLKKGSIQQLMNQRNVAYSHCQFTINTDDLTPTEVVEKITQEIQHVY